MTIETKPGVLGTILSFLLDAALLVTIFLFSLLAVHGLFGLFGHLLD